MPPKRAAAAQPADDTFSFNSQLSGDLSVAGSSRRMKPASDRGLIEFFVGSKRSNYSTPVYLFIVFIVSVVLWTVMPWMISAYADLNLESRIVDLENAIQSGSGGSGEGLDPATLAEMKQMQGEVAASLAEVKALQAVVDSTIQQFQSQNELASNANTGDLSGVTHNLAKLESDLKSIVKTTVKHDGSIADINTKLNTVEGQVHEFETTQDSLKSDNQDTRASVDGAKTQIDSLEAKIKDARYSMDGLASTVASKCSAYSSGSGGISAKTKKPNFALRCAGAQVEDVSYPQRGLGGMLKDTIFRYTGMSFDTDNPYYNVLDSANEPGQCWCFQGQEANITIRLITPMVPDEFFVHHIFMGYYQETKIDMGTAAPKSFTVVGVNSEGEHMLGDYLYDAEGQKEKGIEQVFPVHQNQGKIIDQVKIVFRESAWNVDRKYTCVYQVGVHGTGALELSQ